MQVDDNLRFSPGPLQATTTDTSQPMQFQPPTMQVQVSDRSSHEIVKQFTSIIPSPANPNTSNHSGNLFFFSMQPQPSYLSNLNFPSKPMVQDEEGSSKPLFGECATAFVKINDLSVQIKPSTQPPFSSNKHFSSSQVPTSTHHLEKPSSNGLA
ncbi:hypothetical protein O181_011932 [Austropuccinia psidii MF-1]|uniref:Uncharacterized protein n=1 Tax=Austropuccinia psidii MF-1 TaxID=1389203 RepID=A0A9Q3BWN8_9BASI|nr:hypothetical protein [Austropuccinia psidii MF-1]